MSGGLENEFDFHEDENDHFQTLQSDVIDNLDLANTASILALNALGLLDNQPPINSTSALVNFLMAKTANSIRYAVKGLKLGYYSSTATVLRSALESLSFAYLFNSNPAEVALWLRNEFYNRPQTELSNLRNDQTQRAFHSMLDLESQPKIIADALHEFKKGANKHTHATLVGLAKEFNVDVGTLLPEEIAEAEGDLDEALDRYALLSTFGENILPKKKELDENTNENEMIWVQFGNQYIKDEISDLSLIAFYLAHRLLDFTQELPISDSDFQRDYKEWHKESKNRGTSSD
jgi:hypothetical protein